MSNIDMQLIRALEEDHEAIQNLGRFYVYDMSKSCGFLKGWKTPDNGLYECRDLSRYFEEPSRHPFLIKIDGELAGFALISKVGSLPEVDWSMGEFFIVSKFQGKGIGCRIAVTLFDQFPGTWEVMQIPENTPAVAFWEKVVDRYCEGDFQNELKVIDEVSTDPRVVLRFKSKYQGELKKIKAINFEIPEMQEKASLV